MVSSGEARKGNLDALVAAADAGRTGLDRSLGPVQLVALGVATIVGAGIFVLTGQAAADFAGPAVVLSFVLAGVAAGLAALCYVELATMIPVSGSTYTFAYLGLGAFMGWVVGWDLLVEYLFGSAAIAAGWSGYFDNALEGIGLDLPTALTSGPFDGGVINLPAVLLVGAVTWLLVLGVSESARATTVLVALKITLLLLFVGFGAFYVSSANHTPFVPANEGAFGDFGWSGVVRAAGVVFYAYIGFDIVCTTAQEARNPRRTVPIGIVGALLVATALYVAVSFVLTGIADYRQLDVADALSVALGEVPSLDWLRSAIDVGAIGALAAGVLATLYGQSRILMRMAEDGMLPPLLARVEGRRQTPWAASIVCGVVAAVLVGLLPIETLATLVSVGTLLAFAIVAIAVMVLRRTRPDLERGFRLPLGPTVPILTVAVTLTVFLTLPGVTLLRLAVWLALGLVVYLAYSRTRARAVLERRLAEVAS